MKSKKKLKTIKERIETGNRQYRLLTDEELEQVSGGKNEVVGIYRPYNYEEIEDEDGDGDDAPDDEK